MPTGQDYPDELKQEIIALLLVGESPAVVARKYGIPQGTVYNWSMRHCHPARQMGVTEEKRERIGQLIIDNLEAQLEATIELANAFKDKRWIKKHSVTEVAAAYAVISDKTYRLLTSLPDSPTDQDGDIIDVPAVYRDD